MRDDALTTVAAEQLAAYPTPFSTYGLGIVLKRPYLSLFPAADALATVISRRGEQETARLTPAFHGDVSLADGAWDALPRVLAESFRSRIREDTLVAAHVRRSPRVRIARVCRAQRLILADLLVSGEATTVVLDVSPGVELDLVEEDLSSHAVTSDSSVAGSVVVLMSLSPRARVRWQSTASRSSGVTIVERLAHLAESATLELSETHLSARTLRSATVVMLGGRGARAVLRSLIVGNGDDQDDLNLRVVHDAPHTTSDIRSWSVLGGEAHAVIRGCIRIAARAGGADGSQRFDTLLLSPRAEVDAIPTLEISAHDVRCSHGATSGRLNAEHLYYLKSRGLSPAAAERLLVTAFIREALAAFTEDKRQFLLERVAELCLPDQREDEELRAA